MFELIGLLGGALFAVGCMPVAWKAIRTGKSVGTPLSTMWLLAVSLTLYSIYLFGSFGAHLPFWFMIVELVCWSIALWYHYFPRHGGWSSNRVRKAFQEARAHQKRCVCGDLNCAYDTSRDAYNGGEVWPDYEPWKPEQK